MTRPILALIAALALCNAASSHAYCLYNKTSSQTMQFAVADSSSAFGVTAQNNKQPSGFESKLSSGDKHLKPGDNFCCKQGSKNCAVTYTKTLDVTLEITLPNPAKHPRCGAADNRAGVKLLADGYLLIRNSRFDSTKPLSANNAPVAVDSMSADGRLLQTFFCPVSLNGAGVSGLSVNDFK